MNYRIVNGAISFGDETILEEINIDIHDQDKIAIIGRNGSGKTTLLKSLIDNNMLEEGVGDKKFGIYKSSNMVIGYLEQMQFEDMNVKVIDEILKVYTKQIEIENKLKEMQKEMEKNSSEENIKKYTNLLEEYERNDGYTYKKEYNTALNKFGFKEEDYNKKICDFSGGQKTKLALVKMILSKPDILLLDEPTNHLDITTIEWLENYLKYYPKAIVLVSHDRMFIDKIVNKTYEIEYGRINEYSGNYSAYEIQKREVYEKELKDYDYQQKEIKRLQAIADRFRYKPTKAKMALSKLKKIEQMVKIEKPNMYDLKSFSTNFKINKESGKLVLKAKDLVFGYDRPLGKISFELYRGKKLGIIGANGTGKSTLLKTITNNIKNLSGEYEYGYNVEMAYFDQQMKFQDEDRTVIEDFEIAFPRLTITQTRSSLAAFMFYEDDVNRKISSLSGGEKVRLALCKILKKEPNLLILDEPTNHMDIVGKESLERLLSAYNGTIIVVSHDRYFINKICDELIVFESNTLTFYDEKYEVYLEEKEKKQEDNFTYNNVKKEENSNYIASKEKNKIKTKIRNIENKIEEKENNIKEIQDEMNKEENISNYSKLAKLQEKIDIINEEINNEMIEWEKLNNMLV